MHLKFRVRNSGAKVGRRSECLGEMRGELVLIAEIRTNSVSNASLACGYGGSALRAGGGGCAVSVVRMSRLSPYIRL
jgi:hypothetical protein